MTSPGPRPSVFTSPASILATWFGAGLAPKAPGTVGSIAALPFAWAILTFGDPVILLVASAAIFFLGIWASDVHMERMQTQHDPGEIVIDEVAGMWLTMLPAFFYPHPFALLLGFIFFRLFDVMKPYPIGWLDARVSGGFGVMVDDVLAGIYAGLCLWFALWVMP